MRFLRPILLRRTHLYLSVFFSPLLLLFILTGWWQTMTSDDDQQRQGGWLHTLAQKFSTVHTDGYFPHGAAAHDSHAAVKLLVIGMCIAMILSIALGLWLAWQAFRSKWPVALAFGLGIFVPVLLLWLV